MCGIAGHLHRRAGADVDVMSRQLDCILHRGPDAKGWHATDRGVVGQTRLSIIDLATGDPPITDESGEIGVAFNGEIYEYARLRSELLAAGHTFRTAGDTEVVAHLAEHSTPAELGRALVGMFAVAVMHGPRRELWLLRDPFGKKPLYWWSDGETFVFGSEIKCILAHPAVTASLDESALDAYLAFGYVPTPRTFFEGIESVPPGAALVVDEDLRVRVEPYWDPLRPISDVRGLGSLGMREAAPLVRRLLGDAVERRLVSDVPLGAFLSGGIDSSAVVALMTERSALPVSTFTIGFDDDEGFDERSYAQLVADRFGTEHTTFVVKPDAASLLEELVWHHDQPFGDSSALPTYLLSQLTKKHVTVALCGDGGDEIFGGYERFAAALAVAKLDRVPDALRRGGIAAVARGASLTGRAKVTRFAGQAATGMPDALRHWISYVPEDIRRALGAPEATWAFDAYRAHWDRSSGRPDLQRILDLNIRTYLLDDLLPKVDRMAMAHGLEVRSPFLDRDLAEAALALPSRTKVLGTSLKRVLKQAMRGTLPDEVLDRPKHGFGVPLDRWFREDLASLTADRLGPSARVRDRLRGDAIDRVLDEHARGAARHGHVLWTLLTLELFLERHGW